MKKTKNKKKVKQNKKTYYNIGFIILIAVLCYLLFMFYNLKNSSFDINKKDNEGLTVLMHLLSDNNSNKNEIKKLILDNRKKIDYTLKDSNGRNILMYAVFYGDSDIIKDIAKQIDNINEKDNDGRTALHLAAQYGKYEAVVSLVELGADINIKDNLSLKPIDIAEFEGFEDIYNYLESKAD
ncbi:ankyrin repeat domain-containing protein [Brachyspira pilosicoli]|uniref:ankyrin repeat domain-containing protein n=1 Tax=Brachyspira pilosicoli TaxID=52584 RepID=UPI00300636BB